MQLSKFKGFIFDADGVLFLGKTPIKGADEALSFLRRRGKKIAVVTNNATRSRIGNAEHFAEMGLEVDEHEIFSSSFGAAHYISKKFGRARIFVLGEEGLVTELRKTGHEIVEEPERARIVAVGLDRKLTYAKLANALKAILHGALFVACNTDPTWPTEKGLLPGTGSVVAALATGAGRKPDVLIGKPNIYLLELALRSLKLQKRESVFIGDRPEMDVAVAHKIGMKSILVLSGVTNKEALRRSKMKPDFVLKSVADIKKHWD